jgi:hypothetical protein
MRTLFAITLIAAFSSILQAHCWAGDAQPSTPAESLAEQANDPTATLTQVQVKDFYTPSEYATNAQPNTLLLRAILAVRPHGPLDLEEIIRPTFQIVTNPLGKGSATRTGFGDTQLFDLFLLPWPNARHTDFKWGVGPYFVFPTASWHAAGQGAWQIGPATAFRYRPTPHLIVSALIQQATSFAYTSARRTPVSSITIQPMITYDLARGWYVGSSEATWKINFRHATSTTIPFSVSLGKIWKFSNDAALNASVAGEWMVYRQYSPQEEQFTLKFQMTLLLPRLEG